MLSLRVSGETISVGDERARGRESENDLRGRETRYHRDKPKYASLVLSG